MNILKKNNLDTTICRVAGGWVRDKLLGKESDDIDIALNDMKGSKLANLINEELYPGKNKVGIIQQNVEKGKNLETATIKINKTWIDLVNLRCEEKDKIGTPLSDAERRDLSINSLFYNINEGKVEDFTNKGINDLENGIIETPIKPEITFTDDPLRILRMLRFAIKYKFRIGNDINNYIEKNKEDIINNFYKNISRERIEKELFKIFNMENSSFAIAYLYSFNILDIILLIKDYDNINNYDKIFLKITNMYILGEYLLEKNKIFNIEFNSDNFNKIDFSILLLTLYFRDKIGDNNTINQQIIRFTYKTSSDYLKANFLICTNFDELFNIINSEQYERLKIGKILRKITYKNILASLLACIAYEYIEKVELNEVLSNIDGNILQKIVDKNKKFFNFINSENMLHIDKMKPLFNGKELCEILNMKAGKEIGYLIDYLLEEQIKDPKLSKEHAIELLKLYKEELVINTNNNDNDNGKKGSNKKHKK
jgi:tRNA nucleotidyltransferase (CCA-adding enzyme)